MTDQQEEAASPDPLSPPAQVDSSLTDEVLTEVSLTETLTVTELMAGLGSPELPPLPPLTTVQLALQAG